MTMTMTLTIETDNNNNNKNNDWLFASQFIRFVCTNNNKKMQSLWFVIALI